VTANDNSFDSGSIAPGKEYKKKFDNVGSYPYHCSIHPNMKGEIIVKD
jgi:plastocyanin